jgi:hypothetical protein
MTTIGYGDIACQSFIEKGINIISMGFSSFMFGYILNHLGEILKDIGKDEEIYKKEISLLSRFFRHKNISK